MSEEPKLICATCGCERPKRFFKRKWEPALCRSCYYQIHKIKERAKEYARNYYQRPGVKERKKERMNEYNQRPEVRERNNKSCKHYRQRPEIKERFKDYLKDYLKDYRQRPEAKERKCAAANANTQQAADIYIKSLIRSESKGMLKAPDIPQNIIELKRQSLILKRTIKQKEDEQHTATDI